jgi:2'-phosphotransferase
MSHSGVISGMRRDAQILIFVDLRKSLQQQESMKWWRSENGVILTEGEGEDGAVPVELWRMVVEVKAGLGVLWDSEGGGNVRELPDRLKGLGMPMGKGRGGGRGGRGRGRGRGGRG